MATTAAPAPRRTTNPNRIGTLDPMGKTRVYTDDMLQEVPAGDPRAAFVWKRGELEARRERRAELGIDENDEAARVQRESRVVETASAARRLALAQAQVDALKAEVEAEQSGGARKGKADLQAEARDLGLDDSGTIAELSARIEAHRAENPSE